jgi:hypothetical protein
MPSTSSLAPSPSGRLPSATFSPVSASTNTNAPAVPLSPVTSTTARPSSSVTSAPDASATGTVSANVSRSHAAGGLRAPFPLHATSSTSGAHRIMRYGTASCC